MTVTQLSVYIENKPGKLAEVISRLSAAEINIRALSLADTSDFGLVRLIVSDAEKAKQLLRLYPVGEVSAQLGYPSVSHFVSIFSEETGLTPYRFKRQSQPDRQEMP